MQYQHTDRHSTKDAITKLLTHPVENMPLLHTLCLTQETVNNKSSRPPLHFSSINVPTRTLSLVQLVTCTKQFTTFETDSGKIGSVKPETAKVIVHESGVLLASVYSSRSSHANFWTPEEVKEWNVPLRVKLRVVAHTPPRIAESLRATRGRIRRIVDWKEENRGSYKNQERDTLL
jgi:hypothetical protein